MTVIDLAEDASSTAVMSRRALFVFLHEVDSAEFAAHLQASAEASELSGLVVEAFQSTGNYRADPNRPQQFIDAAAAVQIDYSAELEPAVIRLIQNLDFPKPLGDATISIGAVTTLLKPTGSNLLLLGAQRKSDLTTEQFGQYWTQNHAPHAVKELRAAPVPIGYQIFVVDHKLGDAAANGQWRSGDVDGWMHITTRGTSDFSQVAHDPSHRVWVLEDEANFVNFGAPMVGQQMLSLHRSK